MSTPKEITAKEYIAKLKDRVNRAERKLDRVKGNVDADVTNELRSFEKAKDYLKRAQGGEFVGLSGYVVPIKKTNSVDKKGGDPTSAFREHFKHKIGDVVF